MPVLLIKYLKQPGVTFFLGVHFLVGCSLAQGGLHSIKSLSEYAESLFIHQNELTQQIMMLSEDEISVLDEEKIAVAELNMHDACHLLNEYADHEMAGEKMSLLFRQRLQRSLNHCEQQVQVMQHVLESVEAE